MDAIVLELVGDQIAMTFRRKDGPSMTRHIELPSALELSSLMVRTGNLRHEINVAIPGMNFRVEKGRSPYAWLNVKRDNASDLIACIEGPAVREIGRRLHDHWLTAKGKTLDGPERSIYVRPVAHYIDDEEERSGA